METFESHELLGPPLLSAKAALYLDFDGTLIAFAARPDHVYVPAPLPSLLAQLQAFLGGAVAVITGRQLSEIDGLLTPARLAGAGVHGAELRFHHEVPSRLRRPPSLDPLTSALRTRFSEDKRVLIEDKGAAVALHFRMAPERAAECEEAMHAAVAGTELEVVSGKMVVEARMSGVHKGLALRALAAQPPFLGRQHVFVGDDRTDEDAFIAVDTMGGYGVKVGAGDTVARFRCADVAAVLDWLRRSIA